MKMGRAIIGKIEKLLQSNDVYQKQHQEVQHQEHESEYHHINRPSPPSPDINNHINILDSTFVENTQLTNSSIIKIADFPIRLQNISFVYPARPDVAVLNGVDLTIPAGRVTALVRV